MRDGEKRGPSHGQQPWAPLRDAAELPRFGEQTPKQAMESPRCEVGVGLHSPPTASSLTPGQHPGQHPGQQKPLDLNREETKLGQGAGTRADGDKEARETRATTARAHQLCLGGLQRFCP